jgi:hypothetical protein
MKYIRLSLPHGQVRVLTEHTYNALSRAIREMTLILENAKECSGAHGELEANLKSGPFWKHVLKTL